MSEWEAINPKVNEVAEFLEIAGDFGDPMEIFREALHNAYDWHANKFFIYLSVELIDGKEKFVITMKDNGVGMSRETIINNFWALGNSGTKVNGKRDENTIGEKGHGTKIYLRSDKITVTTFDGVKAYISECEGAFSNLTAQKMHTPRIRELEEPCEKGTTIRIEGYNMSNGLGVYTQDIIKDYLYWKTKLGSIECEFSGKPKPNFTVYLHALDAERYSLNDEGYEELQFGHIFAKENSNINALFNKYGTDAVDHFVKKYVYQDQTLESRPDIKYDVVIYVEGDEAKRAYNPLIRNRSNKNRGQYRVADRYGIYLCKDYIPIQRVNDWITNFGTGSNSVVMLHGFINCQKLKLTANRGSVANTYLPVQLELKKALSDILDKINIDFYKNELVTLQKWQNETKTKEIEKASFDKRKKLICSKRYFTIETVDESKPETKIVRTFLEPRNEAELYGLFISIYTLYPSKFDFEPLDYDESIGIDLIARNKTNNRIADCEYWYVELKYILSAKREFNHSFDNIRVVVCWDYDLGDGGRISSSAGDKDRIFHICEENGKKMYFLDSNTSQIKIQVIPLRRMLEEELGVQIKEQ